MAWRSLPGAENQAGPDTRAPERSRGQDPAPGDPSAGVKEARDPTAQRHLFPREPGKLAAAAWGSGCLPGAGSGTGAYRLCRPGRRGSWAASSPSFFFSPQPQRDTQAGERRGGLPEWESGKDR